MMGTIGLGSFGKVKKCLNSENGKTYAVKIIPRTQYIGASASIDNKKDKTDTKKFEVDSFNEVVDDYVPPENKLGIA